MTSLVPIHTSSWDGTLPKPTELLAINPYDQYTQQDFTLLPHGRRLSSLLNPDTNEIKRRHSLLSNVSPKALPVRSLSPVRERHDEADTACADKENQFYSQKRVSSAMSDEDESSSSVTSERNTEPRIGFCLCQPEPKIPRPRNAFILYRQHQHAGVVARHPGLPNPEISKIIGEQWRQLHDKDKEEWKALAEEEKARHSKQFPEYRYKPKRNSRFNNNLHLEGQVDVISTTHCQKCGGKSMNPSHQYQSYGSTSMPANQSRPQQSNIAPQPFAPPVRYGYAPVRQQRYDSMLYGANNHPMSAHPGEGPDAKRRRLHGSVPHGQQYHEQYDYRHRPSVYGAPHHEQMPPPSTTSLVHRPSYVQGPPTPHHVQVRAPQGALASRRDPNLTLPPLQTASGSPRVAAPTNPVPQRTGVEAMIMSYPVLSKLKTLNSIAPILAVPGPASPPYEVRGAVIAIEGFDRVSVNAMTISLVEQLEKEGHFAVRVFEGPESSMSQFSDRRASFESRADPPNPSNYLEHMADWHKISNEIKTYITTRPRIVASPGDGDSEMLDASQPIASGSAVYIDKRVFPEGEGPYNRDTLQISPLSNVSPGTTDDKMRDAEKTAARKAQDELEEGEIRPVTRSSRVPAAAQAQIKAPDQSLVPEKGQSSSYNTSPAPRSTSSRVPEAVNNHKPSASTASISSPPTSHLSKAIPIAIVPHYRLTTVDTSSISIPILDNYDPITHWRWHATLWRGCIGADVTVVIKSPYDLPEEADSASTVGNSEPPINGDSRRPSLNQPQHPHATHQQVPPPPQPHPQPFGVEVRLQDYRAVIVKTGGNPSRGGSGTSLQDKEKMEKENENWEKAKRRVAFEVEEFLRK